MWRRMDLAERLTIVFNEVVFTALLHDILVCVLIDIVVDVSFNLHLHAPCQNPVCEA
jgi:hypothetical protein